MPPTTKKDDEAATAEEAATVTTDAPAAAPERTAEGVPVVMEVAISGFRDDKPWPKPGNIAIVPAKEAAELVKAGYASYPETNRGE